MTFTLPINKYSFFQEAQEKTDEITNKFLDKGKDPLSYNPQPIVTASSATSEDTEEEEEEAVAKVDDVDKRRRSRGKRGAIGAASRRRIKGFSQTRTPVQSPPPDPRKVDANKAAVEAVVTTDTETEGQLTEDEMTANNISRSDKYTVLSK